MIPPKYDLSAHIWFMLELGLKSYLWVAIGKIMGSTIPVYCYVRKVELVYKIKV